MNQEEYLRRIGVNQSKISPNLVSLKLLHKQHLLHIPFENLDIHWKRPIILDNQSFYKKIVEANRGGFCYELNGLFYEFLNSFGFQNKLVSVRVAKDNGVFGVEKDHMAILTKIGDENYLVDVGFGAFIAEPLKLITDIEQQDSAGTFLIKKHDDYFQVTEKKGEDWKDVFNFKLKGYILQDFAGMCHFHQTSPDSHFTRSKVCSLMTENGRKTLTNKKFIKTENGKKSEKKVDSENDFNDLLEKEFKIRPISRQK